MTQPPNDPADSGAPVSLLGQRLKERRTRLAEGAEPPAPTERDQENLDGFERNVDELSALLAEEIAALQSRSLDQLDALYQRKIGAIQSLDSKAAIVEPFLSQALEARPGLLQKIESLSELVKTDLNLLGQMAKASEQIAQEHTRITERHSLNGLYEKSGRKIGSSRPDPRKFDESH